MRVIDINCSYIKIFFLMIWSKTKYVLISKISKIVPYTHDNIFKMDLPNFGLFIKIVECRDLGMFFFNVGGGVWNWKFIAGLVITTKHYYEF